MMRIAVADLVVADTDEEGVIVESAEGVLVVELVPPGNAGSDRVIGMHLYAAAGIERCPPAEPGADGSVTLRMCRLEGAHYVEEAVAADGADLVMVEPFVLTVAGRSPVRR